MSNIAIAILVKLPFLKGNKNYFAFDGSNNIFVDFIQVLGYQDEINSANISRSFCISKPECYLANSGIHHFQGKLQSVKIILVHPKCKIFFVISIFLCYIFGISSLLFFSIAVHKVIVLLTLLIFLYRVFRFGQLSLFAL